MHTHGMRHGDDSIHNHTHFQNNINSLSVYILQEEEEEEQQQQQQEEEEEEEDLKKKKKFVLLKSKPRTETII